MRKLIIFYLSLVSIITANSQSSCFQYTYDANGNRVTREVIVCPRQNSNDVNSNEVISTTQLSDMTFLVYPNPTEGNLNLKIENLKPESKGIIIVTDINGRIIFQSEKITESNTINLSYVASGNYIMKLVIDNKSKEWMVVKK